MKRTSAVLALALSACAHPLLPITDDTQGSGADFSTESDLAPPQDAPDLAGPDRDLGAATDLARSAPPDLSPGGPCHVVINELQNGSSQTGTEEFIELYNPCTSAQALSGWHLVYRAASNTGPKSAADSSTLYSWTSGSIPAGGYRIYGGTGWLGASDGNLAAGIAVNGAVGLRDAAGALVDSVAYGTATGGFMELGSAPAPPVASSPGNSIQRIPNGDDSDDNSHDFRVSSTGATPGAANK